MGFIAMKGMAGGLIRDGFTAAAWMAQLSQYIPEAWSKAEGVQSFITHLLCFFGVASLALCHNRRDSMKAAA